MSYILDALRKSQQARQPGPAPEPRGAVHNITLSLPGAGWWLAVGIVLVFGISAAAFIFWRGTVGGVPSLPAETTSPPVSVIEPAPLVKEQAPATEKPAKSIPLVHDLAEEARVPVRVAPKKSALAPDSGKAEVKNRSVEPATVTTVPPVSDDVPLLQQMSMDFQHALPPSRVSIHVYAPDPSHRILFINNRQYHQGDRIDGDVRVEEIVPDGVILSYHGERFKLGRPR
jgi:general secretion pathway protein B